MKALVTGADGMLGRAVCAAAQAGVTVLPTTTATLDITDEAAVCHALEAQPDWVINCAAYTRVDDAEAHEAEATRVNGDALRIIGRAAAAQGAHVLHISTDYVFDGTLGRPYREDDAPNPLSAYGRSKLAGELALASSGCRWTLVRTQWLYGGGTSFVRKIWHTARSGDRVRVVSDQLGTPTHTADLAAAIWRLVQEERIGTWHAAAGGFTSWYDVARLVYAELGADPVLVERCLTAEFTVAARRPLDGRLDTTRLGGMRRWDEVLRLVIARAKARGSAP